MRRKNVRTGKKRKSFSFSMIMKMMSVNLAQVATPVKFTIQKKPQKPIMSISGEEEN